MSRRFIGPEDMVFVRGIDDRSFVKLIGDDPEYRE